MRVPTTPKQQERFNRILAAAAEELLDMRDDSTAVDRIAQRSGTSKATIYRYFGDKVGLERAMVAWLCERARDPLEDIVADPAQSRNTMIAIGDAFANGVLTTNVMDLHRYVVARASTHPELGEIFWDAGPKRTYEAAAKLISQLELPDHLQTVPARQVAEFFLNMLTGSRQLSYFCLGEGVLSGDDMAARVRNAVATLGVQDH
ncbi:MAG: TetR/AcrR family transcriptional regulator [Thalassospira sp.]|uniref:TetR/AcrR family transcriptional regulator n=1 Tax=Thalassospira sp. TaxID=1912094 RepID=UPI003A8790CF